MQLRSWFGGEPMKDNLDNSVTSEQLAIQAQAGSAAAFEELVRRLQVPLVAFLVRRARCLADAEDLAQDAFVRAHRSLASYSSQWRFRTWLFTIAHRLAINSSRRRRQEQPAALDEIASPAAEVCDLVAADEARRSLWNMASAMLAADEVSALWLHYAEELSTAEVGQVLGRSRMAVKTMLFRARKRLEPHLRAFIDGESTEEGSEEPLPDAGGARFKVANA
jgi:RNA polymerase sigma-70 factor (ECF subfamily)